MKGLFHILSPINLDHSSQLRQQSGKTTWTADTLLWLFLPSQPLIPSAFPFPLFPFLPLPTPPPSVEVHCCQKKQETAYLKFNLP